MAGLSSDLQEQAVRGADNLLDNCVNPKAGETVLIVTEDPELGYFDGLSSRIVAERAKARGANVLSLMTPRIKGPEHVPGSVRAAVAEADHTIFFSRIGDQMRFRGLPGKGSVTMMYALDAASLASDFCTLPHNFMTAFLGLLQAEVDRHKDWRISCPLGTEVHGSCDIKPVAAAKNDFRVALFPVTVFRPVPADRMDGRIVLARWVCSTNTHVYDSEIHRLDEPVSVQVEAGRIVDMDGPAGVVRDLRQHMERVAGEFGLDACNVHSWHAGINPRTQYFGSARDDPARWGGMTFASPRYLHFHTCGDYAPGEVCWHVLDPTITFGNNTLWDNGKLEVLRVPGVSELLDEHGISADRLSTVMDIGV
jgi:hypothetical protein